MIFLDASFIVAYVNKKDQNHIRAVGIAEEIDSGTYGPQVVSEYILDEVMTVILSRTRNYELAVSEGRAILKYVFVKSSEALLEKTWKIFSTQKEPYISFTDCNIIAICEMKGIKTLATFDMNLGEKCGLIIVG